MFSTSWVLSCATLFTKGLLLSHHILEISLTIVTCKIAASETVLGILKFCFWMIIIANSEKSSLKSKMMGDFVNEFANF